MDDAHHGDFTRQAQLQDRGRHRPQSLKKQALGCSARSGDDGAVADEAVGRRCRPCWAAGA